MRNLLKKEANEVLTWGEHLGVFWGAKCSGHLGEHMVNTKKLGVLQVVDFKRYFGFVM